MHGFHKHMATTVRNLSLLWNIAFHAYLNDICIDLHLFYLPVQVACLKLPDCSFQVPSGVFLFSPPLAKVPVLQCSILMYHILFVCFQRARSRVLLFLMYIGAPLQVLKIWM